MTAPPYFNNWNEGKWKAEKWKVFFTDYVLFLEVFGVYGAMATDDWQIGTTIEWWQITFEDFWFLELLTFIQNKE